LFKTIICLAATAVGVASLSVSAGAANPDYCHHYASQAVWQFHRNQSIPGCFHGADNRWNPDWHVHFDWCLGAPIDAARTEDGYRGARLHECSLAAWGHP
jgi:hypothetical protein